MKLITRKYFAHLPTPVEELPRLSNALGGPQIFVKRDDQTGLAFGGNKTRKLEFIIAEAHQQGAQMLISAGSVQSNHCRQTAAAAARFGFGCTLVLSGEQTQLPSANFLLDKLFGAHIILTANRSERDSIMKKIYDTAAQEGKKPFLVPYGGSSPTGVIGYVYAIKELMEQKFNPDWIVFATSSGGTHAGMILGKRVFGFEGKLLGISIDEQENWIKSNVSVLASDASEKLGDRIDFGPEDVLVMDDYCKSGYGVLTDAEREAVKMFAKYEGLLLDPVYTGRAAAGMIDLIKKGFFKETEKVLFWHTGGQPALFADKYADII
jgi:D-cysteine desulfhydrase family pyridoxal phosphate-dependent enzyme